MDHFSHWPEFVALPDITAPSIATALFDNWCCRYGVPERFHSDGARNVHGEVMKELCRQFGVDKSKSSRLHPQGDGMAESFVKQLKSCIQKQVDNNGSNWDLFLQATAFAVRTNMAYNTKHTPAEIILGDKINQPLDHLFENEPKASYNKKQAAEFAKELKNRIRNSKKIINENLTTSRNNMKKQFDKRAFQHPFRINDKVMLWKPYKISGLSACFQPNWDGPWSIVKFTGSEKLNCKIIDSRDPKNKLNVHVNQLKLVKDFERESATFNTKHVTFAP